mgnify:CR=1 FL=1
MRLVAAAAMSAAAAAMSVAVIVTVPVVLSVWVVIHAVAPVGVPMCTFTSQYTISYQGGVFESVITNTPTPVRATLNPFPLSDVDATALEPFGAKLP